jgi:uncharacterized protein YjaG (DUF416 family)
VASVIEQYVHYVGEVLADMGPEKTAAFATCCAERLLPLYLKYSSDCGWDTHSYLDDALDSVYDVLLQQVSTDFLVPIIRDITEFIPRDNSSESVLFTPARDCALCVEEALRQLLAKAEGPPASSAYALEALASIELGCPTGVSGFGATAADELVEQQIIALPAIQMEIVWQRRDIEALTGAGDAAEVIDTLRITACKNAVTFVGSQLRCGSRFTSGW